MTVLIPVLGDQLSPNLSSLRASDKASSVVLMAEVRDEATYVPHHPKKIALIFAAMRHFAEELRADGWTVDYVKYDDRTSIGLLSEFHRAFEAHGASGAVMTEAGEWRLREAYADVDWLTILPDDRFVATQSEFDDWADGRKQLRLEYFYREMRRKTGLLMEPDGQPTGGKWNYDHDNRKPAKRDLFMPEPFTVAPDAITREVLDLVRAEFADNFGDLEPFSFATKRADAERAADYFLEHLLPDFGAYQDAMLKGERTLYHSVLSPYLNIGLLDPLELCRRAEAANRSGKAPLNSVEGFIRQIIGWREFVRGLYFWKGPEYVSGNYLGASRDLPSFYWDAQTDMACLRDAVEGTRQTAYAHHIQRLMVTGNFALIAGVDPAQVHEWYLAVYADAFEWVEAPNTIGMSQFADGGLMGSKPYSSSGAYINRMSDYCAGCAYNVKERESDNACPFNALYWDFHVRNAEKLGNNPRLGQIYRNWARMDEGAKEATLERAAELLRRLDARERI